MTPRATYRVQLHKDFDFYAAAKLAPYLAQLGVSHLYASPYFKAHPGSTHGYDIVDYGAFNPELGGERGFEHLVEALDAAGLKHILDFVPNHMGVGGADNVLWLDVLEWGQEADHAGWFDIDWDTDRPDLRNKLLVPFLGEQYGVALEAGNLILKFDAAEGSFAIWAHDTHKLPICPLNYDEILGVDHPALEKLGDAFAYLMRWKPQVMRRARELKAQLSRAAQDPAARAAIASRVSALNGRPGEAASWDRLHALIEKQNWKASQYLVASDDINYRRFFNIATLAGVRMELPDVFEQTHRLALDLIRQGKLDGLRIDHVDGLFHPKAYLDMLRKGAPATADGHKPYIVVEKILGPDEALRSDWPVDGTTGYDFTNLLSGLFIRSANEAAFTRTYQAFVGQRRAFEEIVLSSKLQIIDNEMLSELHRLARSATRVARQNTRTADFTSTVLQRALRQIVAAFPVYRTYIDGDREAGADDLRRLDVAIRAAAANDTSVERSVFTFLRQLLSGELTKSGHRYRRTAVFRCAMKLQQYCGPVMAKGVEDTAFYRYNRFVALNEVGGAPEHFGTSISAFHAANKLRAERWPNAMLATSTHDTKRGEDTRARLAALSTMPDEWEQQVKGWSALLRADRLASAGPDRNDEYLFYQLLVGTWPAEFLGSAALDPEALDLYVERLKAAMTKSFRESKIHSTWVQVDEPYETSALDFIASALHGDHAEAFLAMFRPFAETIAERGAAVSFAQTVLKFTVPGMPDIYQGAELWDLSMVDPDNRRPVDYQARTAALEHVRHRLDGDRGGFIDELRTKWQDGRFKLALTAALLDVRARYPDLFSLGAYQPIALDDPALCAFARVHGGQTLIVVARLDPSSGALPPVVLTGPGWLSGTTGTDVLTGRAMEGAGPHLISSLLAGLPACAYLFPGH